MDLCETAGLRIITARLVLRALVPADAGPFRDLVTRAEVGRMLFRFPPDWSEAEARAYIAGQPKGEVPQPPFRLAIEQDGRFAGMIGLLSDGDAAEAVYALVPDAAGQGYAREALAAMADWAFAHLDIPAVSASVFTDNPASERVLTACGFRRTGESVYHSAARLEPAPIWLYRLDRPASESTVS